MMDRLLAKRLWLYANRVGEHVYQLDPGQGESAGPLMAAEMIAAGIRAALVGLALLSDEGVGDLDKLPAGTLPIARALENADLRTFTAPEVESLVELDRITAAGIERHLLDQAICRMAFRNAANLGHRLAEDLRAALHSETPTRHG